MGLKKQTFQILEFWIQYRMQKSLGELWRQKTNYRKNISEIQTLHSLQTLCSLWELLNRATRTRLPLPLLRNFISRAIQTNMVEIQRYCNGFV